MYHGGNYKVFVELLFLLPHVFGELMILVCGITGVELSEEFSFKSKLDPLLFFLDFFFFEEVVISIHG